MAATPVHHPALDEFTDDQLRQAIRDVNAKLNLFDNDIGQVLLGRAAQIEEELAYREAAIDFIERRESYDQPDELDA